MVSEQKTYADEQAELPSALQDTEIARIMKLVSNSGYKKSEDAPTRRKQEFKPRSLVEIAMEAQQKLDGKDQQSKIEPAQTKDTTEGDISNTPEKTENATSNVNEKASEKIDEGSEGQEKNVVAPIKNQVEAEDIERSEPISGSLLENEDSTENDATIKEEEEKSDYSIVQDEVETEPSQNTELAAEQYRKGYDDGLEAGKNEIKSELEQKFLDQQETFEALIARLTKIDHAETEQLEKDIKTAILSLASERAGISISEIPEQFLKRIELLISRLGNISNDPVVRLNKTDLTHLETAKAKSEILSHITFIEDETLNRGDIIVSSGGIEIEDILGKQTFNKPLNTVENKNYTSIPSNSFETKVPDSANVLEPEIEIAMTSNDPEDVSTKPIKSDEPIAPEKANKQNAEIEEEKKSKTKESVEKPNDENQETS